MELLTNIGAKVWFKDYDGRIKEGIYSGVQFERHMVTSYNEMRSRDEIFLTEESAIAYVKDCRIRELKRMITHNTNEIEHFKAKNETYKKELASLEKEE